MYRSDDDDDDNDNDDDDDNNNNNNNNNNTPVLRKPQLFNRPVNRNKKCQQLANTVRSTQERNRVPLECSSDANSSGGLQRTSNIAQLQQAGCNQVIQLTYPS